MSPVTPGQLLQREGCWPDLWRPEPAWARLEAGPSPFGWLRPAPVAGIYDLRYSRQRPSLLNLGVPFMGGQHGCQDGQQ